jgi:ABC-type polysaccharide/polyol phosphate export permease
MFRSILIIFRQLQNINKSYTKNADGFLNTLEFIRKIIVDMITSVCSSAAMVHKMRNLQFHRYLQRFMSEGQQVFILVANTVLFCLLNQTDAFILCIFSVMVL